MRHNLFLAFKEALHNIVRHATAEEVQIFLKLKKSSFELIVQDNGCGFARDAKIKKTIDDPDRFSSGNGLENMTCRLAEIGGQCEIQSIPGRGTKVIFSLPLKGGTP